MARLASIVWNQDERRLRTAWRIILQSLLLMILLGGALTLDNVIDHTISTLPRNPIGDGSDTILFEIEFLIAMLVCVWLAGRYLDHRLFVDFGLRIDRDWWIDFLFGITLGAGLITAIFLVQLAAGWITVQDTFHSGMTGIPFPAAVAMALIVFIATGITQEVHVRGYLLKNLAEGLNFPSIGPAAATLLAAGSTAVIFALFHWDANIGLGEIWAFVPAGLLYATAIVLTGQLSMAIGLHIAWNFFENCVFGLPVSGIPAGTSFLVAHQQGPELWTGGSYGPEIGLLAIAARFLGILLMVLWVRVRTGKITLHEQVTRF